MYLLKQYNTHPRGFLTDDELLMDEWKRLWAASYGYQILQKKRKKNDSDICRSLMELMTAWTPAMTKVNLAPVSYKWSYDLTLTNWWRNQTAFLHNFFVFPCVCVFFTSFLSSNCLVCCIILLFRLSLWEVSERALTAVASKRLCHLANPKSPVSTWQPDRPLPVPVSSTGHQVIRPSEFVAVKGDG